MPDPAGQECTEGPVQAKAPGREAEVSGTNVHEYDFNKEARMIFNYIRYLDHEKDSTVLLRYHLYSNSDI